MKSSEVLHEFEFTTVAGHKVVIKHEQQLNDYKTMVQYIVVYTYTDEKLSSIGRVTVW
jgi:hypothetical protein